MVELATKRVLAPLFEPLFEDWSYGYRPQRSPHQGLDALGRPLQQKQVHILVEADIRGCFDAVHHEWVRKFLRQRIGDERVLHLISRMVQAGSMEDGRVQAVEVGTPQGSILSPLLANVYLHYVLALWFQRRIRRYCRGEAYLDRFADDCAPRRREGVCMTCALSSSLAAHKMRDGPSQPPCRRRLQTTSRCAGQEPGW